MKNYLFLFGIITSSFLHAQTKNAQIKAYYYCIQKAEMNIVYHRYEDAGQFYRKAFELKYPNDKDLYNAFLISYYTHDSAKAVQYANELAYKGLSKTYFLDSVFDYGFYKYVYIGYDSCFQKGKENPVFQKWSRLLTQLIADDQKVRGAISNESDTMGFIKMGMIDSANRIKLKEYIMADGFPDFDRVGFWGGSDPFINPNIVFFLAWHNRYIASSLDSLIEEAVQNGDFRPDEWATILSERENDSISKYHMEIWHDKRPPSVKDIKQINKDRASLYLEDYDSYKRNWTFAKENYNRSRTDYNPNLYPPNESVREQFIFYNPFLLPSDRLIEIGF